jgi:hypothetical protein
MSELTLLVPRHACTQNWYLGQASLAVLEFKLRCAFATREMCPSRVAAHPFKSRFIADTHRNDRLGFLQMQSILLL